MKLGDICPGHCFPTAAEFEIPPPGCNREQLEFPSVEYRTKDERRYYAVLLQTHDLTRPSTINPKIVIAGLSPGGNQIKEFVQNYRVSRDYGKASVAGAFASLAPDIIRMFDALGLSEKLGLKFPNPSSLAYHPDILGTSLIACASLTRDRKSDDFNPASYDSARRCMGIRFLREILNPAFTRLSHVIILGIKGRAAIDAVRTPDELTVREALEERGMKVLTIPHPSHGNAEYVKLASCATSKFPTLDEFMDGKWDNYVLRRNPKQSRELYEAKRRTAWQEVNRLRKEIAALEVSS